MRSALLAAALGLATSPAAAQSLRLVLPAGATRGTTATFRCYGAELQDTLSVIWLREGLELLELTAPKKDRVSMRVRVPEDAALGVYPFALHTKRGMTRVKLLRVGAMPSIAEAKDHGTRATAQPITLNNTVDGRILTEDVDWYAFEAEAGQAVRLEAEGVRLGLFDLDLQLEVFGPDGQMVLRADESSIGRADPVAAFRAETPGTYHVALRDVAYRGSSYGAYRLHVGTFPRPTGLLPAGGKPGETLRATMLGDLDAQQVELTLPTRPGVHEVFPTAAGVAVPTPVRVVVDERDNFVEGATPEEPPGAPCAFHGVIAAAAETDRFSFVGKKGRRVEIRALARALLSPLDPVLIVRDAKGKALTSNDDGLGLDGRVRFTPPADGAYRVEVRDHLRRGGPDFFYRVEVGTIAGTAKTRETVPGRREEDFGLSVPQGGRNATIVQATGVDARAALRLEWSALPRGVHVQPAQVPAGGVVPVVITAEADAPLGASLARPALTGAGGQGGPAVDHEHPYPTLRVRNNVSYDTRAARALPVAVTTPAPFTVTATPPKVPLVRSGTLKLPVQIARAAEFNGTVTVRALWLPAGVSATTLSLPKGKSAGELTLNANSRATVAPAAIVLSASYSAGGVTRAVSTEVFELDVQQPWITAKLPRAKMEQGQSAVFAVELERSREFDGEVTLELGRVPKGVTYEVPAITAETTELGIALTAAPDARPGRHRSIYARLKITTPAGVIVHAAGSGEIRVDRPLPPDLGGTDGKEQQP